MQEIEKPAGGVVTYTTALTDTGEREQIFGGERGGPGDRNPPHG